MEDLLKKVSQYQLFNFLLSGTVLAFMISKTTSFDLLYDNVVVALFIYYFMGFIVSRVGSLIIEPLYKALGIVKFVPYQTYLKAVKIDTKIDTLSQENNMYRTLVGVFVVYILVLCLYLGLGESIFRQEWFMLAISAVLIILLSFSYRKQTGYIVSRVNAVKSKK
jgi:glucose-6-phosphate-specific signal transduction histidine kinase